jgi:molecular chaperone GrpE
MSESSQTETKDTPPAAAPVQEPVPVPPVPKPEELLAAAKLEAAANYDRYARAVADLENFRKRTLREKEELRLFAASGLMEDIIPILDNLGLGLAAARQQTEVRAIVDGVARTLEQFKNSLARHGLKELNPAGQRFDPHFHECISHQPSAEVGEEHVMQVVRPGYTLNGRLLRPASVIVSSGPAKETKT